MDVSEFYEGMPVVLIEDSPESAGISGDENAALRNGMTGTVQVIRTGYEFTPIGVNWNGVDTGEGGLHTLDGSLDERTGWWCGPDQLALYDPDFKVGERVIAIDDYDEVQRFDTGTVCVAPYEGRGPGVRWDRYSEYKHDCNGTCEKGYGWFIPLEMIIRNGTESQEIEESEFDLAELWKGDGLFA